MDVMRTRGRLYTRALMSLLEKNDLGGGKVYPVGVGARHLTLGVRLRNPTIVKKALALDEQFCVAARVSQCRIALDNGIVTFMIDLPSMYWQSFTRDDIGSFGLPTSAIGIAEKKMAVEFNFDNQPHAGFFGTTGSGKSEAVKSALVSVAQSKTPDETGIVICDANADYGDFENLAHLEYPIVKLPNDIHNALQFVNRELTHRKAENIKDGKEWIVVVEEANSGYGLLSDKENLAVLQNISQGGRAQRIHLVLTTQKPSHSKLPSILDNINNRFIGQVSDDKLSYLLTTIAGAKADKLTGKGDFLHGENGVIQRFQVAMATSKDFASLPRAEIAKPQVEDRPTVDLPPDPTEPQTGRPKSLVIDDPRLLAYYLYCEGHKKNISVRQAAKLLGASYDRHKLYKDFAFETNRCLRELHWRESRKRKVQ